MHFEKNALWHCCLSNWVIFFLYSLDLVSIQYNYWYVLLQVTYRWVCCKSCEVCRVYFTNFEGLTLRVSIYSVCWTCTTITEIFWVDVHCYMQEWRMEIQLVSNIFSQHSCKSPMLTITERKVSVCHIGTVRISHII